MDRLTIQDSYLVDQAGRRVLLRGVNLGGSSKLPIGEPTHLANTFSRHREVTFVGRPFPLAQAHEHYARLRHWGFNCLRFLVTWEAIEHAAPQVYDTAYLDSVAELIALAGEYGLYVVVDPHQDVWSRMTGGDGAPGWTLEAVGFDISNLDLSEAAITMQRRYPDYPPMVWLDNYSRLACCTMFTLFLAGNKAAPNLTIEGLPAQDYLQSHFIGAIQQVAIRLKDMPHVLGYGPLNEPGKGYLGLASLQALSGFKQRGVQVTPAESILLGAGFPRRVPTIEFNGWQTIQTGDTVLNPHGISAWRERDVWREVGVWGLDSSGQPMIVRDDYFAHIDFLQDGLIPFIKRYAAAIREIHPEAILFVESTSTEAEHFQLSKDEVPNIVNAGHWYDEYMLFTKTFDGETAMNRRTFELVKGQQNIRRLFTENIAELCQLSATKMGGVPTMIGELGLMMDINQKAAYHTGDFSMHELALSMYYDALDANLVHSALWNYTADNDNRWGDQWNLEDLSIFSPDQQHDPSNIHSGGRAVKGFSRPYVKAAGGRLISMRFDFLLSTFIAEIDFAPNAPSTLIYIPEIWYPNGFRVEVDGGKWQLVDEQHVEWLHPTVGRNRIYVYPNHLT